MKSKLDAQEEAGIKSIVIVTVSSISTLYAMQEIGELVGEIAQEINLVGFFGWCCSCFDIGDVALLGHEKSR